MKEIEKKDVSRKPDFRYTTILLSKMNENDTKVDPDQKDKYRKRLYIPQNEKYRKIQGSPGAPHSRCSFLSNSIVFDGENKLQR